MDKADELKCLIAKSDKGAFAVVFREYYGKVFRFILSIVKEENQAKDLAQEVFIKLWEKRKRLETVQSLDDYLFIMSRNMCFDYLRRAYRRKRVSLDVLDQVLMNHISLDPQKSQDAKSDLEHVRKVVFAMPQKRRDIYLLSRFDGYSNEDIADMMGISKKTVENQLYIAGNFVKKFRN